jgi:iron(III) transport system permease protein
VIVFQERLWSASAAGTLFLLLVIATVTLAPIGFVVVNAFNVAPPGEGFKFGLEGWREAFAAPRTLNALAFSFLFSIRSFIGLALAFLISWALVRVQLPTRTFIEFSLWLAWFLPALPMTMGWILLLDPQYGLVNQGLRWIPFFPELVLNIYSFFGILWIQLTLFTVPVMTILLTPAFRQFDASLEESARVCGANSITTVRRILFPLFVPSIIVVLIASVVRGLESFELEQLLGVPAGIYVYGTRIYDLVNWEPPRFSQALALSTVFLGVLLLLMYFQQIAAHKRYATLTGRGMSFRRIQIGKWRYLVSASLLFFLVVGIYLPLGMVVVGSFMRIFGFFSIKSPFSMTNWLNVIGDPIFLSALKNSFVIGFSVMVAGVTVYSLLAHFVLRDKSHKGSIIAYLVWLPWAIPGVLLGLSLLWLFFFVPMLSLLHGTLIALVIALMVKEMPIGIHLMKASFSQLDEELEQTARVCGASWGTTFRRVTLPLTAPMIASVSILIFNSAIRDISTPILLSTPANQPLSVFMMTLAVSGEMGAASVVGVLLALLAFAMAIIVRQLGLRLNSE